MDEIRPGYRFNESCQHTVPEALVCVLTATGFEDAIRNADSVNDLRLQIKLNSQRARNTDLAAGTEHMTIV